ncbi:MAG: hypothetical protein ACOY3V_01575 [Pseudomonadota bacterium]
MNHANSELLKCIDTKFDPNANPASPALRQAIDNAYRKIEHSISNNLSIQKLQGIEQHFDTQFRADLANGAWKKTFKGRDILRRFIGKFGKGLKYETFRNLIIAKMKDEGYQPSGMAEVIYKILSSANH